MKHLHTLIIIGSIAALPACSLVKKGKPAPREPQGTVSIKVEAHGERDPIRLAAYSANNNKAIESYKVKDGSITGFILPVGQTYEFRAFAEPDPSVAPPPGAPVGIIKGVKPDPNLSAQPQVIVLEIPDSSAPAKKGQKNADKKDASAPADNNKADLIKKGLDKIKEAAPSIPIPPPPAKP